MDFQTVLNLTPIALLSFGGVWVINYNLIRFTKIILDTNGKLILGTVLAFILLIIQMFIPIELQNIFAQKLEAAIGITVGLTALYQAKKA